MALKKSKTLKSGASGEYWRITKITADRNTRKVSYDISLYIDKSHRMARAEPLSCTKRFTFEMSPTELNGDLNALGYSKIKDYANTLVPDPFSKLIPRPEVPADADLCDCEDI